MAVKKGQIIEVEVCDVAFGGRGIARVDGLVVFVEQAIPGDRVAARIVKKKRNHAVARIDSIIQSSPHRIPAPCRYSGYCGGCKWQFLAYEKQLEYKRRHVADSIAHIGLIGDVPVRETVSADRLFGYRNKMEFSCTDRRWLLPEELGIEGIQKGFALGLHVPGTYNKVIDTVHCLLLPEPGSEILDVVRRYIRDSGVPVYGLQSHVGFWRFVVLRHSNAHDRWMVNIVTSAGDPELLQPLADRLVDECRRITSVINNVSAKKAGVAVGEYQTVLRGPPVLAEKIDHFDFEISANSFFQTNTLGASRLYAIVKEYAELTGSELLVDLYSGTGSIAIYLSGSVDRVIGLEISATAIDDAGKNCRLNHVTNCRFIHGDIKENLAKVGNRPDVMVIDPPRAGMHKRVLKQVLDISAERLVYVSCNPATLARDLGILKDRYHPVVVQPVDMFPHTHHIEAVVKLELKKPNRKGRLATDGHPSSLFELRRGKQTNTDVSHHRDTENTEAAFL